MYLEVLLFNSLRVFDELFLWDLLTILNLELLSFLGSQFLFS